MLPTYLSVALMVVLWTLAVLLVAAYVTALRDVRHLREQRDTLGDHLTATRKVNTRLTKQVEELTKRIANMERVSRSRLYQESMEDQQARIHQATTLLKNARRDVDDAFRALDIGGDTDKR